jgi:hypothetical protein
VLFAASFGDELTDRLCKSLPVRGQFLAVPRIQHLEIGGKPGVILPKIRPDFVKSHRKH